MGTTVLALSRIKKRIFVFDFLVIIFCYLANYAVRFAEPLLQRSSEPYVYLVAVMTLACLYTLGAYDLDTEDGYWFCFFKQLGGVALSAIIVVSTIYLSRLFIGGLLGRGVLLGSYLWFLLVSVVSKYLVFQYLKVAKDSARWIVIGSENLISRLNKDISSGTNIGYVESITQSSDEQEVNLAEIQKGRWSGVIIATKSKLNQELSKKLLHQKLEGLLVIDLCQIYEKFWKKIPVFFIEDRWFLTIDGFSISSNKVGLRLKRLFDIMIALTVLFITWPLMLVTYFLIKLDSHGPAIFMQKRTGKDGHDFFIYKFRSMYSDAEKDGARWAQTNDSRITRVGKYIRLFRIDELPQLFNVLKGDMSFIGPRPERPEFNDLLEKQIPYYQIRHLVRPGITGWAQVQYPYGASVEDAIEKLQYDLYYIKNYSFLLDIRILFKTIKVILFGKGR